MSRKKIFILLVLALLCLTNVARANASVQIKVKYTIGTYNPEISDDLLDYHSGDLSDVNLNFYLNNSLIDKILTDNGTALLLNLSENTYYTLKAEKLNAHYFIYLYNFTQVTDIYVESNGIITVYRHSCQYYRYNATTHTLYLELPVLSSIEPTILWDRVIAITISIIIIVGVTIWYLSKKRRK
jgi:hypothetical protein